MKNQKDLSYFTLRFRELLSLSFPEKINDPQFIIRRSQLAASAYKNAFNEGQSVSYCTEVAESILLDELTFSKHDMILRVVCNEFSLLLNDEQIQPIVFQMLTECNTVFSGYDLSDNFEDTPEYDALYTELTGMIQNCIDTQKK